MGSFEVFVSVQQRNELIDTDTELSMMCAIGRIHNGLKVVF